MNLRQRVKRLETPHNEANDYLIRDFYALCADRAMKTFRLLIARFSRRPAC
jgi:hypothetical protein